MLRNVKNLSSDIKFRCLIIFLLFVLIIVASFCYFDLLEKKELAAGVLEHAKAEFLSLNEEQNELTNKLNDQIEEINQKKEALIKKQQLERSYTQKIVEDFFGFKTGSKNP